MTGKLNPPKFLFENLWSSPIVKKAELPLFSFFFFPIPFFSLHVFFHIPKGTPFITATTIWELKQIIFSPSLPGHFQFIVFLCTAITCCFKNIYGFSFSSLLKPSLRKVYGGDSERRESLCGHWGRYAWWFSELRMGAQKLVFPINHHTHSLCW